MDSVARSPADQEKASVEQGHQIAAADLLKGVR